MKRPGLSPAFLSATLFLAGVALAAGQPAQEPALSARAADLLKRFDKNADGKLDEHELADARESMLQEQMNRQAAVAANPRGPQFVAKMLELFDRNHDGRLDEDERAAARRYAEENGLGENGEVREELLKRFDKNTDGKLDDAERAEMVKFLEARRAQASIQLREMLLRQFDRNGDGRLDDGEWAAAKEPILRIVNAPAATRQAEQKLAVDDEKQRLADIAAEVARRRAQREKAKQDTSLKP